MDDEAVVRKKRWPWVVAVAGIVGGIAVAVVGSWLFLDPSGLKDERAEIAAVQAVAAIGFGVGGLGTLMLFVRRQWLQEQAHELDRERVALDRETATRQHERELAKAADDRHDASERRITELYMAAAEQLGHEKAPVRLAALYALDRLGQNEPGHRQVIVDIWCAYLRQPFDPPERFITAMRKTSDSEPDAADNGNRTDPAPNSDADWADLEYEVRATAQRLLISHLDDPRREADRTDEPPPAQPRGFWDLSRIDLTGANLVNADFIGCWFPRVNFTDTRFHGHTEFKWARFSGDAWFLESRFSGDAMFRYARFNKPAMFGYARFAKVAMFRDTRFAGVTTFLKARFSGDAWFFKAQFAGVAEFDTARFARRDIFHDVIAVLTSEGRTPHTWPAGWVLEPDPESEPGWGRLVEEPTPSAPRSGPAPSG